MCRPHFSYFVNRLLSDLQCTLANQISLKWMVFCRAMMIQRWWRYTVFQKPAIFVIRPPLKCVVIYKISQILPYTQCQVTAKTISNMASAAILNFENFIFCVFFSYQYSSLLQNTKFNQTHMTAMLLWETGKDCVQLQVSILLVYFSPCL